MKPHPPHKLIIERTKEQSWVVVARDTTRNGLHRGSAVVTDGPEKDYSAIRPLFDATKRFRKRECGR